MIDEATIEDRLRRTYAEVAARTTVPAPAAFVALADEPMRVSAPRRARRRPQLALAGIVAVAFVASGVAWTARGTTHRLVVTTTPSTGAPTTGIRTYGPPSTEPPVPAAITGTEQTIAPAEVPSDIAAFFAPIRMRWQTASGGSPHGYRVGDGTAFDIDDMSSSPDRKALPWNPSRGDRGSCAFYDGTLPIGGQGYGIEVSCVPLADITAGTKHAIFFFPDFPQPAQDTIAWAHLPAGTEFVSFTGTGIAPLWERPVDGIAGFTAPASSGYTGGDDAGAPQPTLRAYDANGNVLAAVTAPYLVNFVTETPGS